MHRASTTTGSNGTGNVTNNELVISTAIEKAISTKISFRITLLAPKKKRQLEFSKFKLVQL